MARASKTHDPSILEMALVGYQFEKDKIEGKMDELRAQLKGQKAPASRGETGKVRVKREMSQAARLRIAAAQKKRWAAYHKQRASKAGA